nr:ribonuclease H-like domain, reverse transcriptase, RNA-dependent DNA polymerase [Tanacetum cinerariifolium]
MPSLEDIGIFEDFHDDEYVFGADVDFHNLDSTFQVSPIPTTRIHKGHPFKQVIGDLHSAHFIVYQMDVKSAFLYGKIEVEVYVCQPHGFKDPDFLDKVYKVEKALYGLHQAPRAWGQIDKTLFIKRNKGDILLVQVYVDDIIFGSTKKDMCDAFEILMHEKFQMSSMGELTFFWDFKCKKENTPMETSKPLLKMKMEKRCLWYPKDSLFDLVAYTDGDYAGASLDRKSTTGGCQYLGCRLILWQCKTQTVFANSTTEAEYVAALSCCGQILTSLVKNLEAGVPFYMFSRFIQVFMNHQLGDLSHHKGIFVKPSLTKKVFANMKRVETGFSRPDTPLFGTMMVQALEEVGNLPNNVQDMPIPDEPSSSQPQNKHKPRRKQRMETKVSLTNTNTKEHVPTPSNDPLPSGEDRMQLKELMELCTNLSNKVLNLENERRKIADIDADVEVKMENMYNLDMTHEETVLSMQDVLDADVKEVSKEVVELIEIAKTIVDEVSTSGGELNAANEKPVSAAPTNITTSQPRKSTTSTASLKSQAKDKGKAQLVEEPEILKSRKAQIALDEEVTRRQLDTVRKYQALKRKLMSVAQARKNMMIYLKNMAGYKMDYFKGMSYEQIRTIFEMEYNKVQAYLNKGPEMDAERIKAPRKRTRKDKVEKDQPTKKQKGDELEQDNAKKQKLEEQEEAEELKKNLEIVPDDEDDVFVNVIPLSSKPPTIMDYKIYKKRKKEHFQIIRPNVVCLDRHLSDHWSILLREFNTDYGATPFRLFHSWFDFQGFDDMITQTWNSISLNDSNAMVRFKKKLQALKKVIRLWIENYKWNQMNRTMRIKSKLKDIDKLLYQLGANDDLLSARSELLKQYHDIQSVETCESIQKAKIKWAIEGDENSKFFHGMINRKRANLAVKGVMIEGNGLMILVK